MGQYFRWLNPVKRQYIEGYDFDHGGKRRESSYVGCPVLDALYTLMANEWKDDPVVWIGDDYARLSNETNRTLKTVEQICGSAPYDYANVHFIDVAIDFEECNRDWIIDTFNQTNYSYLRLSKEESNRYFYIDYEEDGVTFFSPDWDNKREIANVLSRKGFFKRKTTSYRYIINHSKKEYIDREAIIPEENGFRYDPFPALMIKEDDTADPVELPENNYCGTWLGDSIEVSNNKSLITKDYEDVSNKYTWENGY